MELFSKRQYKKRDKLYGLSTEDRKMKELYS